MRGLRTPFNPMGGRNPIGPGDWILEYTIPAGGGTLITQTFVIIPGGGITANYGDNTQETWTNTSGAKVAHPFTHTYAVGGVYTVRFTEVNESDVISIGSNDTTHRTYCTKIIRMNGFKAVTSLNYAFIGCVALNSKVPNMSTMTGLKTLISTFQYCSGIYGEMPDISKFHALTTTRECFSGCNGFDSVPTDLINAVSSEANITATWNNLVQSSTVAGTSADIRAVFPTTWGGKNVIS